MKNRYIRNAKISEKTLLRILRFFVSGRSASQASRSMSVSLRTINQVYIKLRGRITSEVLSEHDKFNGAGFYWLMASRYRAMRGRKWNYIWGERPGPHWAFDPKIKLRIDHHLTTRRIKAAYRTAHEREVFVREHCRIDLGKTPELIRKSIVLLLDRLQPISDQQIRRMSLHAEANNQVQIACRNRSEAIFLPLRKFDSYDRFYRQLLQSLLRNPL